jgi:hypothetical protein
MSTFEIGYAMGLIVGEGTFTADRRHPTLSLKAPERDPAPVELLQQVLGGRIFGPYHHADRHYFVYHLRGRDLEDALPLFDRYLPRSYRRTQYEAWRAKHFPDHPVADTGWSALPPESA